MAKKRKPRKLDPAALRLKQCQRIMKGLVFSWSLVDPLAAQYEITKGSARVTHKQTMYRLMITDMLPVLNKIIYAQPFLWRVTAEYEFCDAAGLPYFRSSTMIIHGKLHAGNDALDEATEQVFSEANMGQYVTTHIKAEILGNRSKKEEDFAA